MLQSRPYEYGRLPSHHFQVEDEPTNTKCRLPPIEREPWKLERHILWALQYGVSFVVSSFMVVCIVYTVLFVIKPRNPDTVFDPDSLEYALTKNSRFLECYQNGTQPATADCSILKTTLQAFDYRTRKHGVFIMARTQLRGDSGNSSSFIMMEWCAVVSCLKQWDYKIVPSIPRDAAMLPTLLRIYTQSAFVFLGALYQYHKRQRAAFSKKPEPCKRLREFNILNWLIHLWDLASLIWWWITFAHFAAATDRATAPFVLGWVTPWKYYSLFAFHPYSCLFRKSPRTVTATRWAFYLLASAQWCATCYVLYLIMPLGFFDYGTRDPNPSYDCDASRIPASPGTTTCTASQICNNKTGLFIDVHFIHDKEFLGVGISALVLMASITAVAALPVIRAISRLFNKQTYRSSTAREGARRILAGFRGMAWLGDQVLCGISVVGVLVGGFAIGEFVARYRLPADTLFKVDWECEVVHVSLSQWCYYLDLGYRRGLRIAQMWFNS